MIRVLAFALFFSVLLVPQTLAQRPGRSPEAMAERLKTALALTDSQTVQVLEILTAQREQTSADREKYGDDRDAFMAAARDRIDESDKKIEALLTPGQKAKFAAWKEERKTRMREMRRPGREF